MGLISELKRRNVIRAGFTYAVVWWLLIQVAGLLLDAFAAPDWILRALIIVLALGFPIALVLSWFFEITTDGLIRNEDLPKKEAELYAFRRFLNPIIFSMFVAAIILFALDQYGWINKPTQQHLIQPSSGPPSKYNSLAVLPFSNLSSEVENSYFVDGIHNELLTMLARIDTLRVTSRTSVIGYRNSGKSIPEISRELGVSHILEGGVQRDGDSIRVNAQLIDTTNDEHLWAETFDRQLSTQSLFEIQSGIARAIAAELNAELSNADEQLLANIPTTNLEAYDIYLQGRQSLLSYSNDAYKTAIEQFNQAITLDPSFAGAYAGLCQTLLSQYLIGSDSKHFEMAESACDQALNLDPKLTEVHIALGALFRHHGDYPRSEKEQRLALATQPRNVEAMIELGLTLALQNKTREAEDMFLKAESIQPDHWPTHSALNAFYRLYDDQPGRYEKSAMHAMRVVELSPKNAAAWTKLGTAYHSLQQYDAAKTAWDKALTLEPTRTAYTNRGLQYFYEGRYTDSVEMQLKAIEIAPNDHRAWGRLAESYRALGEQPDLQKDAYANAINFAESMLNLNDQDWRTSGMLATYYVQTGRTENAILLTEITLEISKRHPEALLYAALVFYAAGDEETTLNTLEEMVERDTSYRNFASEEPDFRALQNNERYQRLIKS